MITEKDRPQLTDRLLSKLTDEAVRGIFADCRSVTEIAAAFGVSPATVSNIRRGKNWGHITFREKQPLLKECMSETDHERVRDLRRSGLSQGAIGEWLGRSQAVVWRALKRAA